MQPRQRRISRARARSGRAGSPAVSPRNTGALARGAATTERRRLKPAERRAQLLEAAMKVFAERGLQRATHAEIAEACGVVVGTVFLYFPSRDALVSEVLSEVEREASVIAERCYGGGAAAPEAIRRHVRETLDLVHRKPEVALIWLDWSTAVREDTWVRYLAFQDRAVAIMARSIELGRRAGNVATTEAPDTCARLIVSSTQMLAQMHFTRQPRASIEAFSDAVVDLALGLRTQTR